MAKIVSEHAVLTRSRDRADRLVGVPATSYVEATAAEPRVRRDQVLGYSQDSSESTARTAAICSR